MAYQFSWQPQPNYQLQPQALFMNTLKQVPDYVTSSIQGDLLSAKQNWANAERQIRLFNNALNSGNLSDAEKQQAQVGIDFYKNRQKELAREAEMTRNSARAMGIDTAGFNAENTLEESQGLMQKNNMRAMQNLINLKPVAQQQDEYYQAMRDVGLSPRLARVAAEMKHDSFREANKQQLWNGIMNYGRNGDGSLNDVGMALTGKLYEEDPYMAELFTKGFALPQNTYAEENANQRALLQAETQIGMNNARNKSAQEIAKANQAWEQFKYQNDMQYKYDRLKMDDKYKALEYMSKYYLGGVNKNAKNPASGPYNLFRFMQSLIESGNEDDAAMMMENLTNQMQENSQKFFEGYSDEEMQNFMRLHRIFDDYLKVSAPEGATEEEIAKLRNDARRSFGIKLEAFYRGVSPEEVAASRRNENHNRDNPNVSKDSDQEQVERARALLSEKPKDEGGGFGGSFGTPNQRNYNQYKIIGNYAVPFSPHIHY